MPFDGLALTASGGGFWIDTHWVQASDHSRCPSALPGAALEGIERAGLQEISAEEPCGLRCFEGYDPYTFQEIYSNMVSKSWVISFDDVRYGRTTEDYAGQSSDLYSPPHWQGEPQTRTQLEDRTRDLIRSAGDPELNEWLDWALDNAGSCDPYTPNPCGDDSRDRDRQACDLEPGNGQDPAPATADEFAVHTPMTRVENGNLIETALRMGHLGPYTNPPPTATSHWRTGWGYRHIKEKHGWGAAERAATEVALGLEPIPGLNSAERKIYVGPEYERGGVNCRRWVVVAPTIDRQGDPAPGEIVTSYGKDVSAYDPAIFGTR
jgi:hypothetical protein